MKYRVFLTLALFAILAALFLVFDAMGRQVQTVPAVQSQSNDQFKSFKIP